MRMTWLLMVVVVLLAGTTGCSNEPKPPGQKDQKKQPDKTQPRDDQDPGN
jgi:hypothetical protein